MAPQPVLFTCSAQDKHTNKKVRALRCMGPHWRPPTPEHHMNLALNTTNSTETLAPVIAMSRNEVRKNMPGEGPFNGLVDKISIQHATPELLRSLQDTARRQGLKVYRNSASNTVMLEAPAFSRQGAVIRELGCSLAAA